VPGVLLLERIIEAAQESLGAPIRVRGLSQIKFLAPLLPGEEAVAVMEIQAPNRLDTQNAPGCADPARTSLLRFRVERSGQAIAQGVFQVAIERKLPS
jgi:hypothetical protein